MLSISSLRAITVYSSRIWLRLALSLVMRLLEVALAVSIIGSPASSTYPTPMIEAGNDGSTAMRKRYSPFRAAPLQWRPRGRMYSKLYSIILVVLG